MTRAVPPRALPPMATFSEIVTGAVRAATHRVSEGSRRNARHALEVRHELARADSEVLAALRRRDAADVPAQRRRTAAG